jgi:type IV pilus assembly protein PilW
MKRRKPYASTDGTVLAEYLIASTLGIAAVLAAIAVMQHTNASYAWLQENAVMEEHANYALDTIARAVKQAGYRDYVIPIAGYDAIAEGDFIHGADDRSMKAISSALEDLELNAINGSDVLVIHFSGSANKHDEGMINCAGFAVRRATSALDDLGWSIFYVAKNTLGESELRCKYRGSQQWQSQALIDGVESFQVLYGVDTDGDGFCNITLNATAIDDHDKSNEVINHVHTAWWSSVVSVHVSLLLRAANKSSQISKLEFIDLFGKDYADHFAQRDRGTHLSLKNFPSESQSRLRRVVRSVIYLNQPLTAFD